MQEDFNIHAERQDNSEKEFEKALRPLCFDDFAGQQKVVENLRIFVEAAKYRGEPLDHTLLHGPPGLGKTTLSNIIANELGLLLDQYWINQEIWLDFLLLWNPTMCYSLMKYTGFRP